MNILYIGSHSILEYDEVRLFADLGHDVFSIGSYTDPAHPADDKRPALPNLPYHADLAALCHRQRVKHAAEDTRYYIDYAKSDLAPELLEWADVTIFAAFPDAWIAPQWKTLRQHRVIWRTIGQSDPSTEQYIARDCKGLSIIRYSPKERAAFTEIGSFAGEDAVIRFAKYPADWYGWTGETAAIGNVTQDMVGRGEFCGYSYWLEATKGLPTKPAGPNSEALPGGIGTLDYEGLRAYYRSIRCYLATGTIPASYTLNLIEAMMTGVPVVAMGRARFGWPPIYEADEIVRGFDDPIEARMELDLYLGEDDIARNVASIDGEFCRATALELFSVDVVGPQWDAYLGTMTSAQVERRLVGAA